MSRYNIAIVGMGCIFPSANSIKRYWENIKSGEIYYKKMPDRLWHFDNFHSEVRSNNNKSYNNIGAFIEDFEFPFLDYKLPPNALRGVDPAQLVTLEATREALLDAGLEPRSSELSDAITVIGTSGVDAFAHSTIYLQRHNFWDKIGPQLKAKGIPDDVIAELEEQFAEELKARGHVFNPALASIGAIAASISNRVAQVFGLRSFNMTVDGACASSFVALDTACQALMAGDARIAVAGGTDLGTNPSIYIGFSRVDGLSISGHSCPFDATADGLVIGEGTGVLVLKRLEDALADGNRIRAVIRGLGGSSDGAGQAIYAPSVSGRVDALRSGLARAETQPDDVQYLEAHATSTVVGDANEYDAISTVYGERDPSKPLRLGSVKQQIGHLKAAAGMAGLIKCVLCMENGLYPHMPRYRSLTPGATKVTDSLLIPQETATWEPLPSGKRLAAVTANGFGGVNYHAIVEQGDKYETPPPRVVPPRQVAIVGMQCRVAAADNVETFWSNVTSGKNTFTEVDAKKLGWQYHLDAGPETERITTRVVSELDDFKFNALRFKIFPTALSQISPTQLLGVEIGDRLLASAGFDLQEPKNIGVSVGSMHDDHFPKIWPPMVADEWADSVRSCEAFAKLDGDLAEGILSQAIAKTIEESPPCTEHTLPGWMTNVTAGRMANKLNLHGPNFTVDTACSSGIAALVPAVYQLMFGKVDMMISGGLNRQLSDSFTCGVCALGAVAESTPRPFDASGAGFLIGEGGVLFLLKRLEDARRDNDTIYAIIDTVSGSSEADSKSMVAPSEEAMTRSIHNTLKLGTTKIEEIGVVDTHGSANPASDIVEARAIAAELRKNNGASPVQITAIKSHLGHLYGGSGAASMLSVIQSLRTRTVPGIRNLETVRSEIAELKTRVEPRKGTQPLSPEFSAVAVNSLGLGGANYFAVLRAPDATTPEAVAAPAEPRETPMTKPSVMPPAQAQRRVPRRRKKVVRASDDELHDVFVCLAEREEHFTSALSRAIGQSPIPEVITEGSTVGAKLAVTFEDQENLRSKLQGALRMLQSGHSIAPLESRGIFMDRVSEGQPPDKLAFCFPGQGVQYIGMGRPLYQDNPVFKGVIDHVHELAIKYFNFDLLGHIYGDEADEHLKKNMGTLVGAQTTVFAVEVAMAEVLRSLGVIPEVLIGQSFGEIAALTVAGVWDFETAFQVVRARIEAAEVISNSDGPPLGMMSLVCSEEQRDAILSLVGSQVVLTNINAPSRFILSGEMEAIEKTVAVAESFGAEARRLAIGGAFHSHFMEPARESYRDALVKLPCSPPEIPILSTITGEYLDPPEWTSEYLADLLSDQLITKVNLVREFRRLHDDGVRHYLEVGPGWSLSKMIKSILEDRAHRASPTLHPKVGDAETFRRARAFLMALGRLESAAARQNLPGMFSPDFIEYMEDYEPAVLALIEEVHERYMYGLASAQASTDDPARRTSTMPAAVAPARTLPSSPSAPPAAPPSEPAGVDTPAPAAKGAAEPVASAPTKEGSNRAPTESEIDAWIERVREKLVQVTGYPPEMLETELDLEADLGVDSVQRAEIWVSLTAAHNLDSDARPQGVKTMRELAAALAQLAIDAGRAPSTPPEAPKPPTSSAKANVDVWIGRVKDKLVQVTGYPEEMLDATLDLEADLGVDSVQRAEIWVSLTAAFSIDSESRPQGVRTITELAESLAALAGGGDGAAPAPAAAQPAAEQPAQPQAQAAQPPAEPQAQQPVAAAAQPAPAPSATSASYVQVWIDRVRGKLVDVTGYPEEMLETELDLEADLGVDSVQRAEIWVSLTTAFELDAEARPQGIRTIDQLATALAELEALKQGTGTATTASPAVGAAEVEPTTGNSEADNCHLFLAQSRPVTPEKMVHVSCKRVILIAKQNGVIARDVSEMLTKQGIEQRLLAPQDVLSKSTAELESELEGRDTLIYLAHEGIADLLPDGEVLRQAFDLAWKELFTSFRALTPALEKSPLRVIVPITQDGAFGARPAGRRRLLGAFPAGFIRSYSREMESCSFQLIDSGESPIVDAIERHLTRKSKQLEIGVRQEGRVRPTFNRLTPSKEYRNHLDPGDLVLVTGGARGIVFECVKALAQRTGCSLLLTGRTEQPRGERPAWLSATPDTIDEAIRQLEIDLVREEGLNLRDAKRQGSRARSQWEVERNLSDLAKLGISARYEPCDVTDPRSFRELIKKISRETPIRAVVHGAGIQRAKKLVELQDETVARTLNTKLSPLFTLLDILDWSQVKVLAGFGSVTGVFGNAGQTDYGLANDLLASAIREIGAMYDHLHAQTLEWTAWVGTGMVSDEEAKRFGQAGLKPLTVEEGVELFLEGLLGSAHRRLTVFNADAAFVAARPLGEHAAAARPRARLVETDSGQGESHHVRLSLTHDPYLLQHLVNEEPVVPGTFITEIFAEIAREQSLTVADVSFRRPMQLRGPELDVEVIRNDEGLMALPADRPELEERALANLSYSTCKLIDSNGSTGKTLEFTEEHREALANAGSTSGESFYGLLDQNFAHVLKTGPVFRGIQATVESGELFLGAVSITDDAAALLEIPGQFVFNPVLGDMAVQVVAVHAMQKHRVMAIPFEIGKLHVGAPNRGRDAIIICRLKESTGEQTVVDLAVREPEGRLIFSMDDLVVRAIARSGM